jgi:hypothetical protein
MTCVRRPAATLPVMYRASTVTVADVRTRPCGDRVANQGCRPGVNALHAWVGMRASHSAPSHPHEQRHGGGGLRAHLIRFRSRGVLHIFHCPQSGSVINLLPQLYLLVPQTVHERCTTQKAPSCEAAAGTKAQPCRLSSGARLATDRRHNARHRLLASVGVLNRSTSRAPYSPCAFTDGV